MKWPTYDDVVCLQAAWNRKCAARLLTELLCSGHRMADAVAVIKSKSVTLGIYAEEIAQERS